MKFVNVMMEFDYKVSTFLDQLIEGISSVLHTVNNIVHTTFLNKIDSFLQFSVKELPIFIATLGWRDLSGELHSCHEAINVIFDPQYIHLHLVFNKMWWGNSKQRN